MFPAIGVTVRIHTCTFMCVFHICVSLTCVCCRTFEAPPVSLTQRPFTANQHTTVCTCQWLYSGAVQPLQLCTQRLPPPSYTHTRSTQIHMERLEEICVIRLGVEASTYTVIFRAEEKGSVCVCTQFVINWKAAFAIDLKCALCVCVCVCAGADGLRF